MLLSLKRLKKKQDKAIAAGCVVTSTMKNVKFESVPLMGQRYYAYDDGKIRPSREYEVVMKDIETYSSLPKEVKRMWQRQVLSCYWLYAPESDYFLKAKTDDGEICWFARTRDGGWFGLSEQLFIDCGRLDVTGELYKIAHKTED